MKQNATQTADGRTVLSLQRITGRNRFCGPAVISALTGVKTCEAARHIKSARVRSGRKGWITGTNRVEVINTVSYFSGYYANLVLEPKMMWRYAHKDSHVTLGEFIERYGYDDESMYVIAIHGYRDGSRHWVAVGNGEVSDSGFLFNRKPAAVTTDNFPPHVADYTVDEAIRFKVSSLYQNR